jgi:hypothetical protein
MCGVFFVKSLFSFCSVVACTKINVYVFNKFECCVELDWKQLVNCTLKVKIIFYDDTSKYYRYL